MLYKTGYSFTSAHIFQNFKIKYMTTSHHILKKEYKTREKKEMAVKIFAYFIYLILLDIIKNNITFVCPTVRKSYFSMKSITGDEFVEVRKRGKFADIDFLQSNFTGYQLSYNYEKRNKTIRNKPIYVSGDLKQMITDNTNNGKRYD